jgi:hypothetical protein
MKHPWVLGATRTNSRARSKITAHAGASKSRQIHVPRSAVSCEADVPDADHPGTSIPRTASQHGRIHGWLRRRYQGPRGDRDDEYAERAAHRERSGCSSDRTDGRSTRSLGQNARRHVRRAHATSAAPKALVRSEALPGYLHRFALREQRDATDDAAASTKKRQLLQDQRRGAPSARRWSGPERRST